MTEDTDNRALRLKTLGNAVCPPQAYPIFQYIAMIETGACADICPYRTGGDAPLKNGKPPKRRRRRWCLNPQTASMPAQTTNVQEITDRKSVV